MPESAQMSVIGKPQPRVDGPLKVSGLAMYATDHHFPGLLHGVPVEATIANGRVLKLDTAAAEKMPGVRAIFHRANIGKIFRSVKGKGSENICIERRPPFEDDVVRYYGQYVALAVADTFEAAKAAADSVLVTYDKQKPNVETDLKADNDPEVVETSYGPENRLQSERGDPDGAFASAPIKLDQTFVTPSETHNPIELQAATAIWDGPNLTLYEESQSIFNMRDVLSANVRFAERERPGDHQVRWLWFRQQVMAMDTLPARRRRGAAAWQTSQACAQSQDDVPVGRPSRANPAARAAWRHARRQTRLASARLCLREIDTRRLPRELR